MGIQERIKESFSEVARRRIHLINKGVAAHVGTMTIAWNDEDKEKRDARLGGPGKYSHQATVPLTSIDYEIENSLGDVD